MVYETGKNQKQAKILMVDDNPIHLQLISQFLKAMNFELITASNGHEALAIAESNVPDLILLDIEMPDMSGYETCTHLKANNKTSDIPIIFVSSDIKAEDKSRAFEVGGHDFISKPVQREELLAHIHIHLTFSHLKKKLEVETENKEVLFNILTHDISNCMTVILGQIELILASPHAQDISEVFRLKLEKIKKAAERTFDIIHGSIDPGINQC